MAKSPIERLLRPLRTRLYLMVARAAVRLVDDGKRMQTVQVDVGSADTKPDLEHFQNYGFTSKPKPPSGGKGPEGIALAVGGDGAHRVVICVDDRRYRLVGLEDGEVAIYDDLGQWVKLARDQIHVKSPTKVLLEAPTSEIQGDLHCTGDGIFDGDVVASGDVNDQSGTAQSMAAMRSTFNAHTHTAPGVTSGPSVLPIPPPDPPPM